MMIGFPEASIPLTTPTWPPPLRDMTAIAPTCGPEIRRPYDANERAISEPVPRCPVRCSTKFMNRAHQRLRRDVGLVPIQRRASATRFDPDQANERPADGPTSP